jgi:hypothetical protein
MEEKKEKRKAKLNKNWFRDTDKNIVKHGSTWVKPNKKKARMKK